MGTREYGHVVAMLVGLASSTSSSGTTDSGDGASKRERRRYPQGIDGSVGSDI